MEDEGGVEGQGEWKGSQGEVTHYRSVGTEFRAGGLGSGWWVGGLVAGLTDGEEMGGVLATVGGGGGTGSRAGEWMEG